MGMWICLILYNTGKLKRSLCELDTSMAKDSFRMLFIDDPKSTTTTTTKTDSISPNRVANKDEQAMVKDIFGIDVDIYENNPEAKRKIEKSQAEIQQRLELERQAKE